MPGSHPILPPVETIDGHDELLLREAATERRQRWKRVLYALLAIGLIAGIMTGARPALHVIKAWQARRLARQAIEFVKAGRLDEARTKVQDALAIWRNEPEAQHAAAFFLTRAGAAKPAQGFWEQLEKDRALTADEIRDYAAVELNLGDLDRADALLHRVWPPETLGTRADWLLSMQIALRRGRGAEAVAAATRVLADSSAPARDRLNAAAVVIASREAAPSDRDQAWQEVVSISQDANSTESLTALILLAQQQSSDGASGHPVVDGLPPLNELITRIDTHPAARVQHHLLAIDLRIAQEAAKKPELIQSAVERFGTTNDNADLATLTSWLYAKGEYEQVLALLPPERAVADRALYLQYLDTLAALGRWSDIRASIQAQKFALDPMLAQMFLARCASQLGETAVRDARWQGALDAAGRDPAKLVAVGQYAAKNGVIPTAVAAFEAAIRVDPGARQPHDELVRVLRSAGDTAKLRAAVKEMADRWPDDPAVRDEKAYLDALTGENLVGARNAGRELMHADPTQLAPRVTVALAELRLHHALAALDAFAGFDFAHTPAFEPRQAAVYAAVLWETSFPNEARRTLQGLAVDRLLPEERELIAGILTAP